MPGSRGRFITDQRITHILTDWVGLEVSAEVSGAECQIAVPTTLRAAQWCCMNPLSSILSQKLTDIQHVQILLCEYVFPCLFVCIVLFCFLLFFSFLLHLVLFFLSLDFTYKLIMYKVSSH